MKTFQISVKKREKLGKGETRRLRQQEMVPCVMYGGKENLHFYAHENFFKKIIISPDVYIVLLDIEGEQRKAIMQEIQFHPVTDKITHIDFIEVFDDKPVVATIPVELVGSSIGILNGGKLRQRRRYLKVKGLIKHLPEKLEIDITNVDISDVVKIGDLDYPNLEILDPARSMMVSVVSSRVALKGMELEDPDAVKEEVEEGEEGEEGAAEGAEGVEGAEGGESAAEEGKES